MGITLGGQEYNYTPEQVADYLNTASADQLGNIVTQFGLNASDLAGAYNYGFGGAGAPAATNNASNLMANYNVGTSGNTAATAGSDAYWGTNLGQQAINDYVAQNKETWNSGAFGAGGNQTGSEAGLSSLYHAALKNGVDPSVVANAAKYYGLDSNEALAMVNHDPNVWGAKYSGTQDDFNKMLMQRSSNGNNAGAQMVAQTIFGKYGDNLGAGAAQFDLSKRGYSAGNINDLYNAKYGLDAPLTGQQIADLNSKFSPYRTNADGSLSRSSISDPSLFNSISSLLNTNDPSKVNAASQWLYGQNAQNRQVVAPQQGVGSTATTAPAVIQNQDGTFSVPAPQVQNPSFNTGNTHGLNTTMAPWSTQALGHNWFTDLYNINKDKIDAYIATPGANMQGLDTLMGRPGFGQAMNAMMYRMGRPGRLADMNNDMNVQAAMTYGIRPSGESVQVGDQSGEVNLLRRLMPQIQGLNSAGSATSGFARGGKVGALRAITGCGCEPPQRFVRGGSGGQADDVHAMLSPGEYVMDADVVSALGDGNNEAGAQKLDAMRENIRTHKRSAPKSKIPPAAKSPEAYLRGGK